MFWIHYVFLINILIRTGCKFDKWTWTRVINKKLDPVADSRNLTNRLTWLSMTYNVKQPYQWSWLCLPALSHKDNCCTRLVLKDPLLQSQGHNRQHDEHTRWLSSHQNSLHTWWMQWNKAARCVEILVFLGFHPVPQGKELAQQLWSKYKSQTQCESNRWGWDTP